MAALVSGYLDLNSRRSWIYGSHLCFGQWLLSAAASGTSDGCKYRHWRPDHSYQDLSLSITLTREVSELLLYWSRAPEPFVTSQPHSPNDESEREGEARRDGVNEFLLTSCPSPITRPPDFKLSLISFLFSSSGSDVTSQLLLKEKLVLFNLQRRS